MVEQTSREVLKVAHRAYVLRNARVSFSGPAEELKDDERLKEVYLSQETGGGKLRRAGRKGGGGRHNEAGAGKMKDGRASAGDSEQNDLPVGCTAIAGVGHG